jgi:hypothetical protein
MPPTTKLRTDRQLFGRQMILGGTDPDTNFGDVGAAGILLKPDTADTNSPLLQIVPKTGGVDDVVADIGASVHIVGNLTVDGEIHGAVEVEIPSGPTLPSPGSSEIGNLFFLTTESKLYVFNGTAWQSTGSSAIWPLWSGSTNTGSTVPVELLRFNANLFSLFPVGVILQANAFVAGATLPTGTVELWDITAGAQLANVGSVASSATSNVQEGVTSAAPANAVRTYALRYNRTGGAGNPAVNLRMAMMRGA